MDQLIRNEASSFAGAEIGPIPVPKKLNRRTIGTNLMKRNFWAAIFIWSVTSACYSQGIIGADRQRPGSSLIGGPMPPPPWSTPISGIPPTPLDPAVPPTPLPLSPLLPELPPGVSDIPTVPEPAVGGLVLTAFLTSWYWRMKRDQGLTGGAPPSLPKKSPGERSSLYPTRVGPSHVGQRRGKVSLS